MDLDKRTSMEMHQIRYFLTVAEELNFTRAAEPCHVAQSPGPIRQQHARSCAAKRYRFLTRKPLFRPGLTI